MLQVDKIAYTNKLTKINPKIKFVAAMILLFTAIIFENIPMYIGMFLFIGFVLVQFAGIKLNRYLKFFMIPSSFLLLSLVTILISVSKSADVFLYNISVGGFYIGITQSSLNRCFILFFRALACLSSTYFLALTVPINQLLKILKSMKMPIVVLEMVMLIYRFIMMFLEEYKDMQTAIYLKFGYGNLRTSYRSMSLLLVSLFTRMMNRYEELSISLEVKLYDGDFHV
ncbi:cobalt ECF transporter T component CbiQ [Alkalibaculum bacchi]|jgi:cobalt/nickel transport system permease protein|uniref:cobalt ECF transporter T component CbiQ n=1 Tax=Alkalibaculum bacchi TaxID=645887 RepID=UPI0026EA8870|nr:cobalt ECF transporter T component CbiQ [Alkalibaculum bacchi]